MARNMDVLAAEGGGAPSNNAANARRRRMTLGKLVSALAPAALAAIGCSSYQTVPLGDPGVTSSIPFPSRLTRSELWRSGGQHERPGSV